MLSFILFNRVELFFKTTDSLNGTTEKYSELRG